MARLQKALQELGYDVGEIDGYFGYLTQDAIAEFQREHRLVVDGKAGPQVLETLFRPELKEMRSVYIVRAGERLVDIAQRLGVTEQYLKRSNRLTRRHGLYEGRRLIVRGRYSLGVAPKLAGEREADLLMRRAGRHLTALAGPALRVAPTGELVDPVNVDLSAVCAEHQIVHWVVIGGWMEETPEAMGRFLRRRDALENFAAMCEERLKAPEAAGLFLDLPGLKIGDGSRFLRLVRRIGSAARGRGKRFFVSVPLPATGLRGALQLADIDWPALQRMVDGIVLQSYWPSGRAWEPLGLAELRRVVKILCARIPHWKLLLGVGLSAWEAEADGAVLEELSFQRAMATALSKGIRPVLDPRTSWLQAAYRTPAPEQRQRLLWIPGAQAVVDRVKIVEDYSLHGVVFSPVGGEDPRVWSAVGTWMAAYRHARNG